MKVFWYLGVMFSVLIIFWIGFYSGTNATATVKDAIIEVINATVEVEDAIVEVIDATVEVKDAIIEVINATVVVEEYELYTNTCDDYND